MSDQVEGMLIEGQGLSVLQREVVDYYEEAGLDYEVWSEGFHMHFGFWRKGISLFDREAMLQEMNDQLFAELKPESGKSYLDAGCGARATVRQFYRRFPEAQIDGLTLVDEQVQRARRLSPKSKNLKFHHGNFEGSSFEGASYDGAYALESSCHGEGAGKEAFVTEMARLIKPGGKLVIFDLMEHGSEMKGWIHRLYRRMCDCWAVGRFARKDDLLKSLEEAGFELQKVEDMSWSLVPSVLHIPWVVVKFLLSEWKSLLNLNQYRKNNVIAPIYGLLFGLLGRKYVSYYKMVLVRA